MNKFFMPLLFTLALGACSDMPSSQSAPSSAVAYNCDSGESFAVDFKQPDAVLFYDGETIDLQGERTASGNKYSNDGISFWGKGDSAMLMMGEETWHCQRAN